MDRILVAEITVDWLRKTKPDLAAELAKPEIEALTARLTAEHESAVTAAATAAATAERTRVLGIQSASRGLGQDKLVAKLIEDGATVEAANAQLLEATRGKNVAQLAALRGDDAAASHIEPDTAPESSDDDAKVSSTVGKLRKLGFIR